MSIPSPSVYHSTTGWKLRLSASNEIPVPSRSAGIDLASGMRLHRRMGKVFVQVSETKPTFELFKESVIDADEEISRKTHA
jgi:hypothetical protein